MFVPPRHHVGAVDSADSVELLLHVQLDRDDMRVMVIRHDLSDYSPSLPTNDRQVAISQPSVLLQKGPRAAGREARSVQAEEQPRLEESKEGLQLEAG